MLITGLGHGGAEHQLVQMAERLGACGWRVGVVSMLPLTGYDQALASLGVPLRSLGMVRGQARPVHVARLARVLRRWRPAVLHSHMVHANLLARVVRLVAPVPAVVSTVQSEIEGGPLRTAAYRLTDRLATLTTAVSHATAERYLRIGAVPRAARMVTIPNSVDVDRFRPDAAARARLRHALGVDDRFVWLAAGRLDLQKDYPNMLHAFAHAERPGGAPEPVLLVAGEGPERAAIEALTAGLGLAERVRFLGLRSDMPGLMNAADAFVLSSAFEGLALVTLEAAATGLPVVTTTAGGAREVFGDVPSVVPTHNPAALGEAMTALMEASPDERDRLGRAGQTRIRSVYSVTHVVGLWDALYRRLGARPGGQV